MNVNDVICSFSSDKRNRDLLKYTEIKTVSSEEKLSIAVKFRNGGDWKSPDMLKHIYI